MRWSLLRLLVLLLCPPLSSAAVAQTVVTVPSGGDLQAVLDTAAAGTVIELAPGATFAGNFVVRGHRHLLTIRSGGDPAGLPGAGRRTDPTYSPKLAKLRSNTTQPALSIAPGATYITLENLEFLPSPQALATALALGAADTTQTSAALAPRHIVVDRILMNVPDGVAQLRGIALNSAHTHVVNSYVAGFKAAGSDSQGICGWNGPGPFVIENNYIEGAGENIMFGGGDPKIPDLVPTNIRIRWNHLRKPVKWRGLSWTVKNLFELKNAQDVVLEGNLLEYNWKAAQDGYSIVLTPRNQDGGAPNTVVQRVRVTNNWVRHVSSVFNVLGRDNKAPSLRTNDIEIRNNVFEDVSYQNWGGVGRLMQIEGTNDLRLVNNTSLNTGTAIVAYGNPSYGFVLENNVVNYGGTSSYGIIGDNHGPGNDSITAYFPGAVVLGNVMPNNPQPWRFPSGNYYPATWADVGFVDFAGGNYRLAKTSAYISAGTDGHAPGADVDAVLAAMVVVPPIPPAQPACSFSVAPAQAEVSAAGGTLNLTLTANYANCSWTAASDQTWATPTPLTGSGSATVHVTVAANTTTTTRRATLTVAGTAVTLTQAAAAPASCTFSVAPTSYAAPAAGGSVDVSVTASASTCGWTASANKNWVTVSPQSDTGSGSVRLTVTANKAKASRSATVTIAGMKISVSQSGAAR